MQDTSSGAMKRILIAEDEKAYSRALSLKLRHEGFEVDTVADGEQAVEALKKQTYHLVLLDIMMPKKNGFGVLQAMQQNKIVVPTVVLSNLAQPEDEAKVLDLGAQGFYIKSNITLAEVTRLAHRALGTAQ